MPNFWTMVWGPPAFRRFSAEIRFAGMRRGRITLLRSNLATQLRGTSNHPTQTMTQPSGSGWTKTCPELLTYYKVEYYMINLATKLLDCEKLAELGPESSGRHDHIDAF